MAPGRLQSPGSEYGPCVEKCFHLDCANTRTIAESNCEYCNEPIGYERGYYELFHQSDKPHERTIYWVHSSCHQDAIDATLRDQRNEAMHEIDAMISSEGDAK
jgi:hypothetical protein